MCTKMKICVGIDSNVVDVTSKNKQKRSNGQESDINIAKFKQTDKNQLSGQKKQEVVPDNTSRNQNANFMTLTSLKTIEGLTERQVTKR